MRNIGKFILRVLPAVIFCAAVFAFGPGKSDAVNYGWAADFQRFTGQNGEKYYKSSDYKVKLYDGHGGFSYCDISGGTEVRRFELVHEMTGERKPAYCIAPGLPYTWLNIYRTDTDDDSAFRQYFNALPESARRGISYALMFGYKGNGVCGIQGANAGDFWMATQAIIWEYQQGIRTDPHERHDSGLVNADVFYNIVSGKPAESCYDRILSDIAGYTSLLSFCSPDPDSADTVYTLNETFLGSGIYQTNYIDASSSASGNFYVVNESGERSDCISVIRTGSSLIVRSTRRIEEPELIRLVPQETYMHKNTAFFFTGGDGEQPLVTCGSIEDPFCQYMRVETKEAVQQYFTLNVNKQEENGNVAGVPFLFQWSAVSGTVSRTVLTDENGVASVIVPAGYSSEALSGIFMYVAELGDEGYTASVQGSGNCTVMSSGVVYRNASGAWVYGSSAPAGAENVHQGWCIFPNYSGSGTVVNMTVTNRPDVGTLRIVKLAEIDTDETFGFRIEGLESSNGHIDTVMTLSAPSSADMSLPAGRYRISEILPEGSIWAAQEPQIAEVTGDSVTSVGFINSLKTGSVLIEKRSEDDCFEGVSFCIRKSDGSLVRNVHADEGEGVNEYNGENVLEILVSGLPAGSYTVTETCPGKYVPQSEVNVTVEPGESVRVYFNNVLKRGDVMLVKNDSDTGNPVPMAFYTLYKSDGTAVSERLVTDENGCIRVGNLTCGSYYFLEDEAPSGYMISSERAVFTVDDSNYGREQTVHVTDKQVTGSICITKSICRADVVPAHGWPVFSYTVSGELLDGKTQVYCLYVEFTENDLQGADADITKSVVLDGLPAGQYTVTENKTNRYETESVSAEVGSASVRGNSVLWTPAENDRTLHVTFSNKKTDSSRLSHSELIINEIGGTS